MELALQFFLREGLIGGLAFYKQASYKKCLLSYLGVITFDGGSAKLAIKLNTADSWESFKAAVDKLGMPTYKDGADNVQLAFNIARNQAFTEANGGRKDVKKLVIYLTSGEAHVSDIPFFNHKNEKFVYIFTLFICP